MTPEIKEFRSGIFALNTRRFGTVAELMIKQLYEFENSHSKYYDLYDEKHKKRIEVKFSTVKRKDKTSITLENVISQCTMANILDRALSSPEIEKNKFDCNIQQIKRSEFDILYYGLFFTDKIKIYKMTSDEVRACPGYSDKQHKGNKGEGQFHINNKTIEYHKKHHIKSLTYEELYNLFDRP